MNNPSLKSCPFCKGQIPANSEKCPLCKMTVIERFETRKIATPSLERSNPLEEQSQRNFSINKYISFINHHLNNFIKFINRRKGIIAIACIVIFLVLYFNKNANQSIDPDKTIYSDELQKNNKQNNRNYTESSRNTESLRNNTSRIEEEIYLQNKKKLEEHKKKLEELSKVTEKYIPNGKVFWENEKYFNGLGELTIKNGTENDAVVKLVSSISNKSVLTIYIRRNSNYTIKEIKDGNYRLYFAAGKHYDENKKEFLLDCSFSVFEEDFPFSTEEYSLQDRIRTEYSVYEITLYSVIGGKARTDEINKNEFILL